VYTDMSDVPPLLGKDPLDPEVIYEFTDGTNFQINIVGRQASTSVPAGLVISQNPPEWTPVANEGAIDVIVSTGPLKPCGNILSGGTTQRTKYKSSTVPFGVSCNTVKEVQPGLCTDGVLTFDGSAAFDSCSVLPQTVSCKKSIKKVCKAGFLSIENCVMPAKTTSVKKDLSYKGSFCHQAPKTLTIWTVLGFINSYSIKDNKVNVNLGCNAQFDVEYEEGCKK